MPVSKMPASAGLGNVALKVFDELVDAVNNAEIPMDAEGLPSTDPDDPGALWNDDGTIRVSGFDSALLAAIQDAIAKVALVPETDPAVAGEVWINVDTWEVSAGT